MSNRLALVICESCKMSKIVKKVGKSEVSLAKAFCSRSSDEDLQKLSDLLPQLVAWDRANACYILQKDQQIDRWLSQATGAEDWFARIDSIGEVAKYELDSRNQNKKNEPNKTIRSK